jgi:hypothetical protein
MAGEGFGAVTDQDLLQAQQQKQLQGQQQAGQISNAIGNLAQNPTEDIEKRKALIQAGQGEGTAQRGDQSVMQSGLGMLGSISQGIATGAQMGPQGALAGGIIGGASRLF